MRRRVTPAGKRQVSCRGTASRFQATCIALIQVLLLLSKKNSGALAWSYWRQAREPSCSQRPFYLQFFSGNIGQVLQRVFLVIPKTWFVPNILPIIEDEELWIHYVKRESSLAMRKRANWNMVASYVGFLWNHRIISFCHMSSMPQYKIFMRPNI